MEHEICPKMLRNCESENFEPLHVAIPRQKNARLGDVFLEVFERETSSIEGQSMHQKNRSNPAG